jgi:hypothetical protein
LRSKVWLGVSFMLISGLSLVGLFVWIAGQL